MPLSSAPWAQIEAEYVTGADSMTLGVLASRYGVTEDAMRHRSCQEHPTWGEKRRVYREAAVGRAVEACAVRMVDRVADLTEQFASRFAEEGLAALDLAGRATNATERRNLVLAAAIACDKWRLNCGLVTASQRLETAADSKLDENLAQFVSRLVPAPSLPGGPEPEDGDPEE